MREAGSRPAGIALLGARYSAGEESQNLKGLEYQGETFETELFSNREARKICSKEREMVKDAFLRKTRAIRTCRAEGRKQ